MSKTTLRKRIALTATSALFAGVLTVASAPVATAHNAAGADNIGTIATVGTTNGSLFVATQNSSGTAGTVTATAAAVTTFDDNARSKGLLAKDSSSGTAQTATVLAGGSLSLMAPVSTAAAFSATGGSFSSSFNNGASLTFANYNSSNTATWPTYAADSGTAATAVATLWSAPTTVGTYTISLLTGYVLQTNGTYLFPSSSNGLPTTLSGKITVTVVAASAGGSYSVAYSACNTAAFTLTESTSATAPYPNGVDSSLSVEDGGVWFIDFNLNDGYNANLDPGNIVATATNGALINIGASAGSTPVAGTASTDTNYSNGSNHNVVISQPTAGAPLTTTVTISYNGTTVCTKTVTIRGKVASLEVANIGTQALSGTGGSSNWIENNAGTLSANTAAGLFTVVAKDSAGNLVSTTSTLGSYSADATTLTTTVQAIVVGARSNSASSTSVNRFNVGTWYCGDTAGSANVKLKFTTAATGDVVTSPAFNARCAGAPSTFTVALDKPSYILGDLVTATVQFLDSKGNKSNTITAPGANTWTMPMLTSVDWASSATAVTKTDGSVVYKWTVGGTAVAATAGTYTGVISYSALPLSTNATPTYKISTGSTDVSFSEILKSVVALIASINKQIQALQKLILNRKR